MLSFHQFGVIAFGLVTALFLTISSFAAITVSAQKTCSFKECLEFSPQYNPKIQIQHFQTVQAEEPTKETMGFSLDQATSVALSKKPELRLTNYAMTSAGHQVKLAGC